MGEISFAIGERLRRRRTDLGYSREYTSELADLHPTYIGQLERGEKNVTVETLYKICSALDYPISELFYCIQPEEPHYHYARECYEKMITLPEREQKKLSEIMTDLIEYKNS